MKICSNTNLYKCDAVWCILILLIYGVKRFMSRGNRIDSLTFASPIVF